MASAASSTDEEQVLAIPMDPQQEDFFSMGTPASARSEVALLEQGDKADLQLQPTNSAASMIFQDIEFNKRSRVLSLGFMLPICYFLGCGGPTGIEPLVTSSSPLYALVGLLAFPILVSVPFDLLISEMCTAFPDDGGFVIWVTNAFGPFWGFQEGFWSWVSTILNNALYPGLVLASLGNVVGDIQSSVVQYAIKLAITVVISLPTLFGTKFVGSSTFVLVILVTVPFIVATAWFFGEATNYGVLTEMPGERQVNWKELITQLFWSYDGMCLVSLFGGQVANPSRTYPRAIFITLFLTTVTYLLPIAGALAANKLDWRLLEDGSLARIARIVCGSLMHSLMVISAICTNVGLFTTATFAQCYQVNGMARQDLIPVVFAKRHYFFETPYLALLLNTVPVLFLIAFDFNVLLDAANCLSSASQVLLIIAAIRLRMMHSDNYQFNKFPRGNVVVTVCMVIPMAVVGYVFAVSLTYVAAIVVVLGVVYGAIRFR